MLLDYALILGRYRSVSIQPGGTGQISGNKTGQRENEMSMKMFKHDKYGAMKDQLKIYGQTNLNDNLILI